MAWLHDKVTVRNQEMKLRGIAEDKITYNTILSSIALCGQMHRVPGVLRGVRDADPRVDPDVVTHSAIIKGFCKAGDLHKGMELFNRTWVDANLEPG